MRISALTRHPGHQNIPPMLLQNWMILTSADTPVMSKNQAALRVQMKSIFNVKTPVSAFTQSSSVMDIPSVPGMMMKTTPCVMPLTSKTSLSPPSLASSVRQKSTPIFPQSQLDATILKSVIMMKMKLTVLKILTLQQFWPWP